MKIHGSHGSHVCLHLDSLTHLVPIASLGPFVSIQVVSLEGGNCVYIYIYRYETSSEATFPEVPEAWVEPLSKSWISSGISLAWHGAGQQDLALHGFDGENVGSVSSLENLAEKSNSGNR